MLDGPCRGGAAATRPDAGGVPTVEDAEWRDGGGTDDNGQRADDDGGEADAAATAPTDTRCSGAGDGGRCAEDDCGKGGARGACAAAAAGACRVDYVY